MKPKLKWDFLIPLALGLFLLYGQGFSLPSWPGNPLTPSKPTAATYFYEKDSGGVPPAVGAGISKLNEQGIRATTHEDDTTNANQQIPKQYAVSLPAAREAGLPALVVMAGEKVVRTVKAPTTEESVLEAAQ